MAGHPTKDELSGFILGKLPLEASDAVADHLEQCPPCQETIHDLEAHKDTLLQDLRQPPPPSPESDPECRQAVERAGAVLSSGPSPAKSSSASPPSLSIASGATVPSREQFLAALKASGVIDAEHWSTLEKRPAIAQAADGAALARALVECGALTKFQATLLYQNKPKGLLFGEYVVLDLLGAGGMGQVFKARHRSMDRIVALKVLAKAAVNSPDAVKRFQREVKAAAKLIHPNIVIAHDAGQQDGVHFLVMEYVPGSDLSALVKRDGPLPVDKVVSYIMQAARGLAFAHAKGVVHRDIKPGNLLVDHEGIVRILDMGLARLDGDTASKAAGEGLTQTGQVMGTVDYMAPEQAFDTSTADAKADMYSLGCTLYRILTGQNMFTGDTLVQKILAHREKPIPSLAAACPNVPPQLDAIYQRMVAKQPADRPTMAELVTELELLAKGEPTTSFTPNALAVEIAPKPSRTPKPSESGAGRKPPHSRKLVAAGAAGFLLVCLGVWLIVRDKDGNETARVQVPTDGTATMTNESSSKQSTAPVGVRPASINGTNTDVILLGNTFALRWNSTGKEAWNKYMPSWTVLNRAASFQNAQRVEEELKKISDEGVRPRVIMLQISGATTSSPEQHARALQDHQRLLASIQSTFPESTTVITSPIFHKSEENTIAAHRQANAPIARLANDKNVFFFDLDEVLIGPDDQVSETLLVGHSMTTLGYERWAEAMQPLLAKLLLPTPNLAPVTATVSPNDKDVDVVFLGSSILSRWTREGQASWRRLTSQWRVESLAVTGRVVFSLENELDVVRGKGWQPRVFVISAGSTIGSTLDDTLVSYRGLVQKIAVDYPQAKLVLMPVLVGTDNSTKDALRTVHRGLNDSLRNLADQERIFIADPNEIIYEPSGAIRPELATTPGSMLTAAGYERLTDIMEPLLTNLLSSPSIPTSNLPVAPQPGAVSSEVDIVLLGGNYLRGWEVAGDSVWKKHFSGRTTRNLAVGGRSGYALSTDLSTLTTQGLQPRVVLLQVNSGLEFQSQLAAFVKRFKAALPSAKLILTSAFDHADSKYDTDKTRRWNGALQALADDQVLYYFDLNAVLNASAEESLANLTAGPNITVRGYQRWAEALEPLVTKLLTPTSNPLGGSPGAKSESTGEYALDFDGTNRSVAISPFALDKISAFTVELWLRNGQGRVLSQGKDNKVVLERTQKSVTWIQEAGQNEDFKLHSPTTERVNNSWEHVAIVYQSGNGVLYMNGEVVDRRAMMSIGPLDLTTPLTLFFGGTAKRPTGQIRCLRISKAARYDKNFTPQTRFDPDADTLGLYHFDEGVGDVLRDSSGNGHDGKIVGAKWILVGDRAIPSTVVASVNPQPAVPNLQSAAPPPAVAPFDSLQARAHQEAWAKHLGTNVETTNSIGMKLVLIPPGEFLMGSTDEQVEAALKVIEETGIDYGTKARIQNAERPQHRVVITKPLLVGATEVTVGQFKKFAEATGYKTEAEATPEAKSYLSPDYASQDDLPAAAISWSDATAFCDWLTKQNTLDSSGLPGSKYRLPTEAEWEHACRAGTTTQYYFGDDYRQLDQFGWSKTNSSGNTHPVAAKPSNPFGLFDMHGNVTEWCADLYDDKTYEKISSDDPVGAGMGKTRVLRGGRWNHHPLHCRSAHRDRLHSVPSTNVNGFRVVREIALPTVVATNAAAGEPAAASPHEPHTITVTVPSLAAGQPITPLAFVSEPAPLPGVRSWTIETSFFRPAEKGAQEDRDITDALAYDKDGKRLAVSGADGVIRILEGTSGRMLKALLGHAKGVRGLAWSPTQSDVLASVGADGNLRLWDTNDGRCLEVWGDEKNALDLYDLAWSPDGRFMAIADRRELLIYDVAEHRLQRALVPVAGEVIKAAWSSDGRWLAYRTKKGKAAQLNVVDAGTYESSLQLGGGESVIANPLQFGWSPNAARFFVQHKRGVVIYEMPQARKVMELAYAEDRYGPITWLADGAGLITPVPKPSRGNPLVVYSAAKEILFSTEDFAAVGGSAMWNVLTGRLEGMPGDAADPDHLATQSPDGRMLAGADWWGICLRTVANGERSMSAHPGRALNYQRWSPDGTRLACGTTYHSMALCTVWDVAAARTIASFHSGPTMTWLHDGKSAFTFKDAYDAETGLKLRNFKPFDNSKKRVFPAPDGKMWAVIEESDRDVSLWSVEKQEVAHNFGLQGSWKTVVWSPDGTQLAALEAKSERIIVWEIPSGRIRHNLVLGGAIHPDSLRWSRDGKWLATGPVGKPELWIWDASTGRRASTIQADSEITSVHWSADGNEIVGLGLRKIEHWERETAQRISACDSAPDLEGEFSPDGRWCALHDRGATILWDAREGRRTGTLLTLQKEYGDGGLAIGATGHWSGNAAAKEHFVYVLLHDDGRQETLKPDEFAEKYRWKNDPAQVRLFEPSPRQSTIVD